MCWLLQILFRSLPKAQAASLLRLFTSASTEGTLLPRNTYSSTLSTTLLLIVISRSSDDITLHFVGLIFIPHRLHDFSSWVVVSCSSQKQGPSVLLVSSAYRMLFMRTSPIWIQPSRFLMSFITNSKNKLKRLGDRRHPCLTPVPTLNQLVMFPLTVTEHSDCSYMLWISPTMTLSTPLAFIHFHRASLQMVSNAALKSTKFQWSCRRLSLAFSMIWRTASTASVVPREERKPHCSSIK